MKWGILVAWLFALISRAESDPSVEYRSQLSALEAAHQTNKLDCEILFKLGHLCHQQGITGDASAVKLAERYLTELKRLAPTNAFGRALLGSIIVMKARDAFLPTTKLKLVRQGCAEIDAAVRMSPADANVRFTRASNNLFLPDLCGRREIVKEDLEWLHEQSTQPTSRLEAGFRQYVALFYGLALQKWGDVSGAVAKWRALRSRWRVPWRGKLGPP
jgi:hypothetical protein